MKYTASRTKERGGEEKVINFYFTFAFRQHAERVDENAGKRRGTFFQLVS